MASQSNYKLIDTIISSNIADLDGGGIYYNNPSSFITENIIISNKEALYG